MGFSYHLISSLRVESLSATVMTRAMITATAIPSTRELTNPAPPARLLDVFQQTAAERGHSVETIWAYRD